MNASLWVALIPSLIGLTGLVVAIRNNKVANGKINHITVLTNSTLTEAKNRIDELERQVARLIKERNE